MSGASIQFQSHRFGRDLNKAMSNDLLQKLRKWRIDVAQRENVTLFRVFPNKVLEAIASMRPKTKDEMLAIKGIRERKFEKYDAEIIAIFEAIRQLTKPITVKERHKIGFRA